MNSTFSPRIRLPFLKTSSNSRFFRSLSSRLNVRRGRFIPSAFFFPARAFSSAQAFRPAFSSVPGTRGSSCGADCGVDKCASLFFSFTDYCHRKEESLLRNALSRQALMPCSPALLPVLARKGGAGRGGYAYSIPRASFCFSKMRESPSLARFIISSIAPRENGASSAVPCISTNSPEPVITIFISTSAALSSS